MNENNKEFPIEIDGRTFVAQSGQMVIEIADQHGIYIPRFCYHKALSVAANCRMCLVDVEKAPKPLPACATPVSAGMKVRTRSDIAIDAQRSVMEFLLINHPLDCPICDQGGECELQDLAMGYGRGISRYQEKKRVVTDSNLGTLIQTDMTRCIHCTRCVRFGDEIAGLRELGAVGRGEHTEISTYVNNAMQSELSGNVIDLCPVGALTSKPFRYRARSWEMTQYAGIAPHDGVGSNIELHTQHDKVMRVVPKENSVINDMWISDRDRFSYLGLSHPQRLSKPKIKREDGWHDIDWQDALDVCVKKLQHTKKTQGGESIHAIISSHATNEEHYLLFNILQDMGARFVNYSPRIIDKRFSNLDYVVGLPTSFAELEQGKLFLFFGSDSQREVPLVYHRIRQAIKKDGEAYFFNTFQKQTAQQKERYYAVTPSQLLDHLFSITRAFSELQPGSVDENFLNNLSHTVVSDADRAIARSIQKQKAGCFILLGEQALSHPDASLLYVCADMLAQASGAQLVTLPHGANAKGAKGIADQFSKINAGSIVTGGSTILFNVEPTIDCWSGSEMLTALEQQEFVISFSSYSTATLEKISDLLLPLAPFAENEGSYINLVGQLQCFAQVVRPRFEAKHGWRVLRLLGERLGLSGFDFFSLKTLRTKMDLDKIVHYVIQPPNRLDIKSVDRSRLLTGRVHQESDGIAVQLEGMVMLDSYASDPIVRRSAPLRNHPGSLGDYKIIRIHPETANLYDWKDEDVLTVDEWGSKTYRLVVDSAVAKNSAVHIVGGLMIEEDTDVVSDEELVGFPMIGMINVTKV